MRFPIVLFLFSVAAVGQCFYNATKCNELLDAISYPCTVSFDDAYSLAFDNPNEFQNIFCETNCKNSVMDYYYECDEMDSAIYLDFLCSKSQSGVLCANILNDVKTFSEKDCIYDSERADFRDLDNTYGCCLYSYYTLYNSTYASAIYNECGVDNPGPCYGGAVGTLVSSSLLLIPAFVLGMLV